MSIDWNKAPEGATHYIPESVLFYRMDGNILLLHCDHSGWVESEYKDINDLSDEYDVIERPKQEENVMQEFKVGDKVYCPLLSSDIFTVATVLKACSKYPLVVYFATRTAFFTVDGKIRSDGVLQSVFHATPENKALLDQLYRTEFEAPPVKLSGSDLTRAKLKEFGKPILCWVSDSSDEHAVLHGCVDIIGEVGNSGYFTSTSNNHWFHAIPYTGGDFLMGKDFE